jgi:hypothetical protein
VTSAAHFIDRDLLGFYARAIEFYNRCAGTMASVAVRGRVLSHEPHALALRMAKHFGHKVPVEERDGRTSVTTRFGRFHLVPDGDALAIELEPENDDVLPRLREVVESHLQRFARGAPCEFSWDR